MKYSEIPECMSNSSTMHKLKIDDRFKSKVQNQMKKSEVRYNDRDYQKGDIIEFKDIEARFIITHILQGGEWGIEKGYVVLSIERLEK